jgi:O-antigen ligase
MQLYKHKSVVQKAKDDKLFVWFWMRWSTLTAAERFACAHIILIPVWWVAGLYKYMLLFVLLCVVAYEVLQHRELRLQLPSLPVVALFTFGAYQIVRIFIHYAEPGRPSFSGVFMSWFCPALLLWYVQSNNVKIRIEPVAWACTVSAIQMIVFWLLLQFVLPKSLFLPPQIPTLFTLVKGGLDPEDAATGIISPFLAPYEISTGSVGNLYRLSLFFVSSQLFGFISGFFSLVALEIKNRWWSLLLLAASFLLMALSATRAIWVVFPLVFGLRYILNKFGNRWGPPIISAALAAISFVLLSIPPATYGFLNLLASTSQSVDEMRAGSTEQRMEIYRQTWLAIQENPLWGHGSRGGVISLSGADYNLVGSHSVILGDLLYMNGWVGTVIFVTFWISLFVWLYQTRTGRPFLCFFLLLLFTLVSPTMAAVFDTPFSALMILLCVAIRYPKQNALKPKRALRRSLYA